MKKFLPNKRDFIIASTTITSMMLAPTAFAAQTARKVLLMISKILTVFSYAGILLLVYAVLSLILAFKNEDAESKVNAITQISIAIVLLTLSGTVNALLKAAGVSGTV